MVFNILHRILTMWYTDGQRGFIFILKRVSKSRCLKESVSRYQNDTLPVQLFYRKRVSIWYRKGFHLERGDFDTLSIDPHRVSFFTGTVFIFTMNRVSFWYLKWDCLRHRHYWHPLSLQIDPHRVSFFTGTVFIFNINRVSFWYLKWDFLRHRHYWHPLSRIFNVKKSFILRQPCGKCGV